MVVEEKKFEKGWVKAFWEGRDAVQDQPPYRTTLHGEQHSSAPCFLSDADRRWTAHELAVEVTKLCSTFCTTFWVPQTFSMLDTKISEVQQWHHYAVKLSCWTSTKGKLMTFLDEASLLTKPGLNHTKSNLKCQSNEWKHSGSPCPKKLHPTQCAVKVMFVVAYDIDVVILHHAVLPRQMVNAAYYSMCLQHYLHPALRRKRLHLVVQNSIILYDNARSHTATAVTDLLRRWQWEILEHPLTGADARGGDKGDQSPSEIL